MNVRTSPGFSHSLRASASFRQLIEFGQVDEHRAAYLGEEVREFLEGPPFVKRRARESGFLLESFLVPERNQSLLHCNPFLKWVYQRSERILQDCFGSKKGVQGNRVVMICLAA